MFEKITAFFMSLMACLTAFLCDMKTDYKFETDTASAGRVLDNMAADVNVWEMGSTFISPQRNEKHDVFAFAEYVQLMACTGGTVSRDLFRDPLDRTVKDDYDFANLIENCRGILSLGAKPHLKLGNTPLKLTENPQKGVFSDNVNPPDDYDAYYNYIAALAQALCEEFGRDEVRTWRFGVMTEFENSDWFITKDGDPAKTAEAYCKLYDYSAAALQDVLGKDICIGAHAMAVTEGLWDEELFVRHCAEGTNYKTGEKGARLCYLSASFYDVSPGTYTSGYDLPGTIAHLRSIAEKYGFNDLFYGVDEGRILVGNSSGRDSSELFSRSAGATWQAAYDARLYGQMIDNDISYFSFWDYLSDGLFRGNPSVSFYTARETAKFAGCRKLDVQTTRARKSLKTEVKTYAAYDEEANTVRLFTYNYSKKLKNRADKTVEITVSAPQFADGEAEVTVYRINDDCNFFDEWTADRKTYGITDDMFSWSPDDFMIDFALQDGKARELYYGTLYEKYAAASVLTPETFTVPVKNGKFSVKTESEANTVTFMAVSGSTAR